jgi:hypothetical protein
MFISTQLFYLASPKLSLAYIEEIIYSVEPILLLQDSPLEKEMREQTKWTVKRKKI